MKELGGTMKDLAETKQTSSVKHQCSKGNFLDLLQRFQPEERRVTARISQGRAT